MECTGGTTTDFGPGEELAGGTTIDCGIWLDVRGGTMTDWGITDFVSGLIMNEVLSYKNERVRLPAARRLQLFRHFRYRLAGGLYCFMYGMTSLQMFC